MSNFCYLNYLNTIIYNIQYAINALSTSIFFSGRKLYSPCWTWINFQQLNFIHNSLDVGFQDFS